MGRRGGRGGLDESVGEGAWMLGSSRTPVCSSYAVFSVPGIVRRAPCIHRAVLSVQIPLPLCDPEEDSLSLLESPVGVHVCAVLGAESSFPDSVLS